MAPNVQYNVLKKVNCTRNAILERRDAILERTALLPMKRERFFLSLPPKKDTCMISHRLKRQKFSSIFVLIKLYELIKPIKVFKNV